MGGIFRIVLSVFVSGSLVFWATRYSEHIPPPATAIGFLQKNDPRIDSVIYVMRTQEKLGQLFMLIDEADSLGLDSSLYDLMPQQPISGIVFKGYSQNDRIARMQRLKELARRPLLFGLAENETDDMLREDFSWAAIDDDSLLQEIGEQFAQKSRETGIRLRFFPLYKDILDAENQSQLIDKMDILSRGMQQAHVLGCFTQIGGWLPSETDTSRILRLTDPIRKLSRKGAPAFSMSQEVLDQVKFHFHPKDLIKDYWKDKLDFNGLVFSSVDKNISDEALREEIKKSMTAGAEVLLLYPHQLPTAFATMNELMSRSYFTDIDINTRVKRILQAKSWVQQPEQNEIQLLAENHEPASKFSYTDWKAVASSITLLKNDENLIPFSLLRDKKIHLLSIGPEPTSFLNQLRYYGPISDSHYKIESEEPWKPVSVRFLKGFGPVIMAFGDDLPDPVRDTTFFHSVEELRKFTEVIIVHFGSPKGLAQLPETGHMVQAYNKHLLTQELTAQLLFGGIPAKGKLPIQTTDNYVAGSGLSTTPTRLSYTLPEAVGLSSTSLSRIDSIVYEGLGSYAMPGCQVLVAKSGKVIYHKAFGHHTYTRKRMVWLTDLYDLASVTKVAATTIAAMDMYNEGRLQPHYTLSRFFKKQAFWMDSIQFLDTLFVGPIQQNQLPDSLFQTEKETDSVPFESPVFFRAALHTPVEMETDTITLAGDSMMVVSIARKGRIKKRANILDKTLGELLSHTSGLPAGLPILPYMYYRDSTIGKYDRYFSAIGDSLHRFKVAADFYLKNNYWDSLWQATMLLPVGEKRFEYSDANMILVQQAMDSLNEEPIDMYLKREIYERLGMQNASFNPRSVFEYDRLIPTEYDGGWRGQLLRGYVHDPTAALLGGVAGNAGLFSNANDLAILFQMLLNGGNYGGEEYFKPETIELFTHAHEGYRGYGFDKPSGTYSEVVAPSASPDSYGHSGFTGTCVWVDPDQQLTFIFLSNRIHPKANNWKINSLGIRSRIHQVIYDAILESGI